MRSFFVYFLLLLTTYSCNKQASTSDTDNLFTFKDYIYYTTSGLISVGEKVEIGLAKEVETWEKGTILSEHLFTIEPKVEGRLVAQNSRAFNFIPSRLLLPDTEYTVRIHLDKIYGAIPNAFKSYTFRFKTIAPNFSVNTRNLHSYDKHWQYIDGVFKSADLLSLDQVKTVLQVDQMGKDISIRWDSLSPTLYEFKVDSIQRFKDDSEITIAWSGKKIGIDQEGQTIRTIPSIRNFTIVNVGVRQSPEQYVEINFSDPVKKQQNFQGLVKIENVNYVKFTVDGNVLKVYPDTRVKGNVNVEVFQGIQNVDGNKLKDNFSEQIAFQELKPAVRLINNGVILPNSERLQFNFEAVNLRAVDLRVIKIFEDNVLQFLQANNLDEINRYSIRRVGRRVAKKTIILQKTDFENTGKWKSYGVDLSQMIKADPGAIYQVELSFKKSYSMYSCDSAERITNSERDIDMEVDFYEADFQEGDLSSAESDAREEAYWDNLMYNYRNNRYYRWEDRENPCKEAYYHNENHIVTANLLGSNIGVIAKKSENRMYHFAVTDILTTSPIANATIHLYNFQQQEISSQKTDRQGFALFDENKNAAFAIVEKGKSKAYLKLDDGNTLSLSKFDVSGKHLEKGLKGYIYGERGVWRPGDSLHLTFVLNDKANPLPENHPVRLEVTDARGKLQFQKVNSDGINGFYRFTVPTRSSDVTGNWSAKIIVGGTTFHKNLPLETVKPNRLKINIDFDNEVLSSSSPIRGKLGVKWLHGADAKNLKAEVKAKFTTTSTAFKAYPDYIFSDPTRKFSSEEVIIYDRLLNNQGKAMLSKKVNFSQQAPGMLKASFLTRVFENGGDFSMDVVSKNYAPYETFVGLKSPKGRAYGSFYTDEDIAFDVVTVNAKGQPVQRENLEVKVYQIKWRWWWNSSYDDLASYAGSNYKKAIKSFIIHTGADGKTSFKVNIPEEEGGRYLIRIYDPKGKHATGRTAYFYKNWWQRPAGSDPQAAKMLVFSSDKEKYNVGETARITFPSGTEGRALVSIENGTEVLDQIWVKTQKGETTTDIPITKEMAPNVYVNISLLQPHATTTNDLPMRLYGVIPLLVHDPLTIISPKITMPNVLRPDESYEINVSEENGKRMTYTVAVVDEGLLDLTRFKTPNAWDDFYSKEALGVKTWDMYDYVIGAYSGSLEQVYGIGGDGEATKPSAKKANRFTPVVRYLGPFTLEKGATQVHKINMPKYIGSVRAMVVAGDKLNGAYGSVEKTVPVRKPLMVLSSLPRKLRPGEQVTLPVTVFAMESKIKKATIRLKLSPGIKVIGASTQQVSFVKPDEKMIYFNLDVSEAEGIGTIEVIAESNGEKSSYEVEIDVLNPNPMSTIFKDLILEPNSTKTIDFETFGVHGTRGASLEFSTMPPMDFTGRLQYLIQYPHGCVEQTTSSVFPQLYLGDIFDLTYDKKQEIDTNIKKAIEKLGLFQLPNGGMSYWIGQNSVDDWGTSYAGHFMIEAEKKGYVMPLSFKSNWIRYQQKAAASWRPSYKRYTTDLAQAYRLYTLALAGHPDLGAMNRLREFKEISNDAKWRLAGAYALAGQKEAAQKVASTASIDFTHTHDYYTYGSTNRNRAMAMETMILTDNLKYRDLAMYLAKELSSNRWMSTQTTAYSLMAMAKMVEFGGGKALDLNFKLNKDQVVSIKTSKAISQRTLSPKEGVNNLVIKNVKANTVYVRLLNSGVLPLGKELVEKRNIGVNVVYKDLSGNRIDVSELTQGTDFKAEVTISNLKAENVYNMALTQIFPSGWEIVNTRFTDFGNNATNHVNFMDIRDDRVLYYFDLGDRKSKTFTVLLNASYLGQYYLPGIQVEAMYDNTYFAREKGQWIRVKK
ncbi:MG2 domain-containing protein [Flavobacteriaceae bacterium F08102]|nr:MG2 domain-containing protein [Flavobacteriaceae bacterium F08102]